jgi:GNAT superfamily N-acetyltransferase
VQVRRDAAAGAATPDGQAMRPCTDADFEVMLAVINAAAHAYEGVIPADRYGDPYMPAEELRGEIEAGVRFWGCVVGGELVAVMGSQDVDDVTLIRHAYVHPDHQRRGLGALLLDHLVGRATMPLLVGTWADAWWAVRFYERHGFALVTSDEKNRLLRRYWSISERQVATSVVLAQAS